MATINKNPIKKKTHEGATAYHLNPYNELRRSVMACLLWEDQFYESGIEIAERIKSLVPKISTSDVCRMAIEAREQMKLRHAPLLLCRELARTGKLDSSTLARVTQRPDELTEFLAIYWQDGRQPLSGQVKKGLAEAFSKFDAYQLAKYNRKNEIKLRDVLRLCHAKPKNTEQSDTWKKLLDDTLDSPDTWEVSLSAGKDKKETFTRLIQENKLGAMALLRNLRNMLQSGVSNDVIKQGLVNMKADRVLPFRFISAAMYAPNLEPEIEQAMLKCLQAMDTMSGKTVLLVDVSGSMDYALSSKSDMKRMDAACGLSILARELIPEGHIYSFSHDLVEIPMRHGFALRDAIVNSQIHGSTYLGKAVEIINNKIDYDRIIVITDEQSHDVVPSPKGTGYMINVASYQNGVGYGAWTHIDGWSESVLTYIRNIENVSIQKS